MDNSAHSEYIKRVVRALQPHLLDILSSLFPEGHLVGSEFVVGNMNGAPGDSFRFNIKKGIGTDFANENKGGDIVKIYAETMSLKNLSAANDLNKKYSLGITMNQYLHKSPTKQASENKFDNIKIEDFELKDIGSPSGFWIYYNQDNSLSFCVARYDLSDGSKQFRPWTPRSPQGSRLQWVPKAPLHPLPLFSLPEVLGHPQLPVLLVEGEKCASIGFELLKESFVVTTWAFGAKSWSKTDFSPLKGRRVIVWPDNDPPGRKAAHDIAMSLQDLGVASVKIIEVPEGRPEKWDIADAKQEMPLNAIVSLIESAKPIQNAIYEESGGAQLFPFEEEFPMDAMPELVRKLSTAYHDVWNVPAALPALCCLGVFSGAIGKGYRLVGGDVRGPTYGNVYIVIAIPSGGGKSLASQIAKPLIEIDTRRILDFNENILPSLKIKLDDLNHQKKKLSRNYDLNREELVKIESKITKVESDILKNRSIIFSDTTTAALTKKLAASHRETLFCFSTEAGDTIRTALGQYVKDGSDFDLFLKGFTGDTHIRERVTTGSQRIVEPNLSMLLLTQPCVLREVLESKEAAERGLIPRILIVELNPPLPSVRRDRITVDDRLVDEWSDLINRVTHLRLSSETPREILCSQEAFSILADFGDEASELANTKFPDFREELSRWHLNALRVALILCLLDDPDAKTVSAKHAENAVRVLRWIFGNSVQLQSQFKKEKLKGESLRLETLLNGHPSKFMSFRTLEKSHSLTRNMVEKIVSAFPELFAIERKPAGPKGGRPTEGCRLLNSPSKG